jgi:hypothetical protein
VSCGAGDRLVRDDEQRVAVRFHLMHKRVETRHQVKVRLATWVAIADLVHRTQARLVRLLTAHTAHIDTHRAEQGQSRKINMQPPLSENTQEDLSMVEPWAAAV